jgi:RHS repeat-associated protein
VKTVGATTTVYIFSGASVIAEYAAGAAAGSPTKEYVASGRRILASVSAGAVTYYHPDQLSTRVETNANGAISRTFGHFPYGEDWYEIGANKWKYTTYERDGESGLNYAMNRYHVGQYGRFLTPDLLAGSVGAPQSLNRYAYAGNDPVNFVDPAGLEMCINPDCVNQPGSAGGIDFSDVGFSSPIDAGPSYDNPGLWGGSGDGRSRGETLLDSPLANPNFEGWETVAPGAEDPIAPPTPPKHLSLNLKVLNDCLRSLNIPVTIYSFKESTPGGNGYAVGIGSDFYSRSGQSVPIVVANDASTYNAAQLGNFAGKPYVFGLTKPDRGGPYRNFTNNNNNSFGTLITQVHELGHSLFTITAGSSFISEPNGEIGKALEDCVRQRHGIR